MTVKDEFTISPAVATVVWSDYESLTYNGRVQEPTFSATGVEVDGTAEKITLTVTYKSNTEGVDLVGGKPQNAGNYTATATTADGNYTITKESQTQDFTIAKATITVSGEYKAEKPYDGDTYTATVKGDGNHNGLNVEMTPADDSFEFTITTAGADADVYAGTIAEGNVKYDSVNYKLVGDIKYSVEIKKATIKLPTLDTVTYSGYEQTATALNTLNGVNGEVLKISDDYTVSYAGKATKGTTPKNADTYTVTVKLVLNGPVSKNYELEEETAEYIINKADITEQFGKNDKLAREQDYVVNTVGVVYLGQKGLYKTKEEAEEAGDTLLHYESARTA